MDGGYPDVRGVHGLPGLAPLLHHLQDDDSQDDGQRQEEEAQPHREEGQQNFVKRKCAGDSQGSRPHRYKLTGEKNHCGLLENTITIYFQANKRRAGYSSQLSLDSTGTVPDLTDRVVRVSFAPAGEAGTSSSTGAVVLPVPGVSRDSDGDNNTETLDQISVSALSLGE